MTDKTEAPERIWATGWGLPAQEESGTFVAVGNKYPTAPNADASAYTRKDLSDAKDARIAELEQLVATLEANLADADALTYAAFTDGASNNVRLAETSHRITELEAKLAKATDGLRECEEEIDDYVRQEYPGEHPLHARYRQRDFSANPARATLAELKGSA